MFYRQVFPIWPALVYMDFSSRSDAMTFLNEISAEYPAAISLAAGRPTDHFFSRLNSHCLSEAMARYENWASQEGRALGAKMPLLQYGRTAGIISDLIAGQLYLDEGIIANKDRTLVTSGCQEAMALCMSALCPDPADVVLVRNPTYVGATGAAHASRVSVFPISNNADLVSGIQIAHEQLMRSGKRARALYLIPTFDNPTGESIDEIERRAVLRVCAELSIIVLEDHAYGMFRYEGTPVRTMAALDGVGCVIHLSTYSKTLAPALRVGALTLPETLFGDRAARTALWKELVQRKSFMTVNTSQISQAMVGGILLEQNGSLRQWVQPALAWYRNTRDTMLNHLQKNFSVISPGISWSRPLGGFFLTVQLPFRFNADDVIRCAVKNRVLVMPMSFFALDDSQDRRVRLSFSGVSAEEIEMGVRSFSEYVAQRVVERATVEIAQ